MSTLNIAITGASGYIGAHLVASLKAAGHRVHAMGRRPHPAADAYIPFALGGQNDYAPLAGIDWLIHCAYDFTCIGESSIRRVNYEGSVELFTRAKAQGVKKIIFISSVSAFEGAISDYGRLKFATEAAARDVGALIVRPGLVFGRNAGGIVGALYKLAGKLPVMPLVGRGDQNFYPCHIDDLSALINYLIAGDVNETEPITAAREEPITFRGIIAVLAQAHNKRVMMVPVPYMIMYAGLKTAEVLHLRLGMRSDSLRYMKHINPNMDFSFVRKAALPFRPFTAETLEA